MIAASLPTPDPCAWAALASIAATAVAVVVAHLTWDRPGSGR